MDSRCGSCTACCKLTHVPELKKPVNEWCPHCAIDKGCTIYDTRPPSCRKFECLWYQQESWSPNLRPDKVRVMMELLGDYKIVLLITPPGYPRSWQDPLIGKACMPLVSEGYSLAISAEGGKGKFLVPAAGRTGAEVMAEIEQYAKDTGAI